jgi:hypothetical protein
MTVKAGILCLLLLSACADKVPYDYELAWVCASPEGCERADDVKLIDRLNLAGDFFYFFRSTTNEQYGEDAQRFDSESLPPGCWWLYGILIFGQELEPAKTCSTSGGFDIELSIPNRDAVTYSRWRVEARELGYL